MRSPGFKQRMNHSAQDFVLGVQSELEKQLQINILPVEDSNGSKLAVKLDQAGIDAFYFDENGNMRGLASRMNYHAAALACPSFSLRLALWDNRKGGWDMNREYQRKLEAANSPEKFILFPKLHVESFSEAKGEGKIAWSVVAETKDIVNYIQQNMGDKRKVNIFQPFTGEKRQVVRVPVEGFAKEFGVHEVRGSSGGG